MGPMARTGENRSANKILVHKFEGSRELMNNNYKSSKTTGR